MRTRPKATGISVTAEAARSAVSVRGVSHRYGQRQALADVSLDIAAGEIFAVLGPNGSGKTTLFRLLSTLIPLQQGRISVLGSDAVTQQAAVRQRLGVVFQAPSLDRQLTVAENIRLMGRLYGLAGAALKLRVSELLDHFALQDRADERVERLSGGLKRRVELAKGMVHSPPLLVLDEPTTGLDPAARSDVWQFLKSLRAAAGTTIVFTTHYLDEADAADRLAILDQGRLVALGAADELRSALGGDSITLETDQPVALAAAVHEQFGLAAAVLEGAVRLECAEGHRLVAQLVEAFGGRLSAVHLGKPTLDDVFIAKTGHRFWGDRQAGSVRSR